MDNLFFPPLPVPMIKDECEEIIIDAECSDDCGGKSQTDLWDEEVRRNIAKLVVYQNEKVFSAVSEEYIKLLKRNSGFIQDKQNLLDKIINHVQMFATFYQEQDNSFHQKYLDVMEEIMTVFNNVQMDMVRQIKKRGCDKSDYVTNIKAIAQNLIRLLSSTLLYNLKHILHVLLKATKHDVEPPSWKDIMNTVYAHFLIQFPLHDYSSESYCRNFLLFERWKEITRVENHKDMERTLYCRCRQTPKSVKADKVISSILMPSSVDSVTDIVTHLIKGKGNAIKSYFDYIEKQKKKSTADEPVCLNDLSFCDLDEDLERESHGSDECSKIFYDIVKDYENAKTQGIQSIAINNDEVTEEPSEEGDCIVIDDDDGPESRQRESNLVCVISDSDSDCEMVYLSNPTKKKNNIKTKSTKSTPSIPQLWSKTFPESTEKTSAISETNSRSAQGDDNDDDIEILDSECVSSVEPIGKKSAKDDFSISFERTHIQKGDSDILEVLKNLVVANDPEVIEANDEVEVANSSETDLNVVSTPDKNIQGDSNNITSNLTDSTTDHSKTNIQDGNVTENNSHHCSCCVKNKMASSPPLLISSDQNSGDNREIERGKIAQVSTEIRIEGLESMPNGHTYSYGLITPPSDQPAEGSSSPTCENVYVQIPPTDSPRSVINSESEEIALEDGILSNSTSLPAEDENAKTKNSEKDEEGENNLAEESALINESVEQNTEEVVENIADGENSATVEESHVLDEENGITEKNNEIENVTPIISEELIVFKNRPSPTSNDTSMVDSIETSVTENDKASPASVEGGEASFSTNAELTNFPQYVIINGQHYVLNNEIQNEEKGSQYQMPSEKVLTDKNYTNFVANGVYIDENGQECFVENEDNIQTVIIDNVYYSCENGLLTIEEVNQLNSNSSAEKVTEEVIENANDITNVDHPNDSNVTSNMNPEVTTKEYQNTDFNDVTSTTPPETVSEEISIKEIRRKSEENVISHSAVEESYPAAKKDSKKSKIMFTSTESIKLTDFDKFERSVNKLVDLDEQNDLWESAFSGPVTKLKSNSDATFSGDGEEMYSFQETKEKKKSKRNKSEDVCRSYSVSPIENSPEYETIETSDFKKYIQEKETILHTHSEKKKHRKHNSVLIHLDKSKIPESVLQKAKEHKKHHKTTEEAQYSPKSILKRKSVDEPATPSKKRATASASEVSCDRYKIEPEYELKKVEKERDKEKGEHSATKHHKRRSSESEKQKAIEVVFGKSRYMKHNHEHSAEESKRKSVKEPKKDHHVSFIELKNLSSYRKQQVAFSSVIRYYSKRRKVYDPQLFEMLPEVSLPFFNEKELLKKWDSQRTGKIDVNRWKTLEKYLNVHHKDRGMKRSCIQERVFYDKTTNTAEVIVYNGGSTHESSSLTSSPSYSGANNYNSGIHQQHAHLMDKSRGNGALFEKSTPPGKKRGNARKSVSNNKTENTSSIAASYQCRNTNSNDVTVGGTTSEEKYENLTFRPVGTNSENSFYHSNFNHTPDKLKTGTSNTQKKKRGRKPSKIDPFPTKSNDNQYKEYKKARIEKETPRNSAHSDISDKNRGSYSATKTEVKEEKKSSSNTLQKNTGGSEVEKVHQNDIQQVSNSKTVPKGIIRRESNTKKVRVTFGAVIVNSYDVDINELENNSNEKEEIQLKSSNSLKTTIDLNGLSSNRKDRKMTTSYAIRKIFEDKIKNKAHSRKRKSHKKIIFDECIMAHKKLKNEIKKEDLSKQDSEEDSKHKLKTSFSISKSETLPDSSVNQDHSNKPLKRPAEQNELAIENGTTSKKLHSPIISDPNTPSSNKSSSINFHISSKSNFLPDTILQRTEEQENGSSKKVKSVDSLNQINSSDSLSQRKKLSPLPVLYNLSPTSSKCYKPK